MLRPKDGERVVLLCCLCVPNAEQDQRSMILLLRTCVRHGETWHRKMIQAEDGTLRIAHPLSLASRASR